MMPAFKPNRWQTGIGIANTSSDEMRIASP